MNKHQEQINQKLDSLTSDQKSRLLKYLLSRIGLTYDEQEVLANLGALETTDVIPYWDTAHPLEQRAIEIMEKIISAVLEARYPEPDYIDHLKSIRGMEEIMENIEDPKEKHSWQETINRSKQERKFLNN